MSDDFDKRFNYLIPLKYKSHKENIVLFLSAQKVENFYIIDELIANKE